MSLNRLIVCVGWKHTKEVICPLLWWRNSLSFPLFLILFTCIGHKVLYLFQANHSVFVPLFWSSFLSAVTSLELRKVGFYLFPFFRFIGKEGKRGRRDNRIKGKIRKRVEKRETFWFIVIFSKILLSVWNTKKEYFFKISITYIGNVLFDYFLKLSWGFFSLIFLSIFYLLRCFKFSILCIFPADTTLNPISLLTLRL